MSQIREVCRSMGSFITISKMVLDWVMLVFPVIASCFDWFSYNRFLKIICWFSRMSYWIFFLCRGNCCLRVNVFYPWFCEYLVKKYYEMCSGSFNVPRSWLSHSIRRHLLCEDILRFVIISFPRYLFYRRRGHCNRFCEEVSVHSFVICVYEIDVNISLTCSWHVRTYRLILFEECHFRRSWAFFIWHFIATPCVLVRIEFIVSP